MAITINDVEYDEADLDNNVKNSIAQVQNANNAYSNVASRFTKSTNHCTTSQ